MPTRPYFRTLAGGLLLAGALTACDDTANQASEQAAQQPASNPHSAIQQLQRNQGVVKEVIQVEGYTYIRAENNGTEFWVAGPTIQVEAGEVLGWTPSIVMTDFDSKSLGRHFDRLLFVSQYVKPHEAQHAAAQPAAVVVSVETGGGYSFIQAKAEDGETTWLAVPQTQVAVDDRIAWQDGAVMSNFTSKSLNKTFDQIIFAGGIQVLN